MRRRRHWETLLPHYGCWSLLVCAAHNNCFLPSATAPVFPGVSSTKSIYTKMFLPLCHLCTTEERRAAKQSPFHMLLNRCFLIPEKSLDTLAQVGKAGQALNAKKVSQIIVKWLRFTHLLHVFSLRALQSWGGVIWSVQKKFVLLVLQFLCLQGVENALNDRSLYQIQRT